MGFHAIFFNLVIFLKTFSIKFSVILENIIFLISLENI